MVAAVKDLGDVGVVHEGQGLPLGLEPGDHLAGVHARLDDLEGDLALHGLALLGHPDLAHAPFADPFQELVGADDGAGALGDGLIGVGRDRGRRRSPVGRGLSRKLSGLAGAVEQGLDLLTQGRRLPHRPASRKAARSAGGRIEGPAKIVSSLLSACSGMIRSSVGPLPINATLEAKMRLTGKCEESLSRRQHSGQVMQVVDAARRGRKPSAGRPLRGEIPSARPASSS